MEAALLACTGHRDSQGEISAVKEEEEEEGPPGLP